MTTKSLIDGLRILAKYRDKDSDDIGAEHDVIYAYATDRPLSKRDVNRIIKLGWKQEGHEKFAAEDYDPKEAWAAFV